MQADLVLLHPPTVYDFRKKDMLYGPYSDLIPSTPVFEMYPLGFMTINSYLEQRGCKVRIVNLALRMLNQPTFDVPQFISQLNPAAFGIDLHWLPHAHGALAVAKIIKEIHPHIPTVLGGLSASYYHRELIQYEQVDYVLRGDSIEEPLYQLMEKIANHQLVEDVPNLTWLDNKKVRANPISFIPQTLDYVDLRPDLMIKNVFRFRDLKSMLPYKGWWKSPMMPIFTIKGCTHSCITCGASKDATPKIVGRLKPAFRSPESVVKNMQAISSFSRGPIFLIGDIRQAGEPYAQQLLKLIRRSGISNEIIFELFEVASRDFLAEIDNSVNKWTLQLSPETHDQAIRELQDPTTSYSNRQLEKTLDYALKTGLSRLDLFFLIGLPGQTPNSVRKTIDYCEHLFRAYDPRLSCFISPIAPFLDPGSMAFESKNHGYRLKSKSLDEHRVRLANSSWKEMLNYETKWMDTQDLVSITYEAAKKLNILKTKYGRISQFKGQEIDRRIEEVKELTERTNANKQSDRIDWAEQSTICHRSELYWPPHLLNFKPLGIFKNLMSTWLR